MPPVRLGPGDPVAKPKPNIAGFLDPAAAGLGMRGWLCNAEFGLPSPFVVSSANSASRPSLPTAVVVMSSVVEISNYWQSKIFRDSSTSLGMTEAVKQLQISCFLRHQNQSGSDHSSFVISER